MTNTIRNGARNAVCNAVTNTVHNGERTTVQNQNQIQTLLTVSCGVCGQGRIRSNGDLARRIGLGANK